MLKRFRLANFSSFKDEQYFDLTASRTEVLPNHIKHFDSVKILKSAVIYGANASGKTNLVTAIDYARRVIIAGLSNTNTYKRHFRLDKTCQDTPTEFEFEIELDNKFYSYGFGLLLKNIEIKEEWLYEIGKNKPKLIFQRKDNNIEFGSLLKDQAVKNRFEIYKDDMKNQNGQLFLSEIAEKELDFDQAQIINSIYRWFEEKLLVLYPASKYQGILQMNKDHSKEFANYLCKFDTGIVDIQSIEEDFESTFKSHSELKAEINNILAKENVNEVSVKDSETNHFVSIYKDSEGELKVKKLGFLHNGECEDIFELKDESDGTKRLLDFIPLFSKFSEDCTVIIDEFDRSLHPKLTREFFEIFYQLSQFNNSQLIVSTHESTLLDLDFIRRDEIWFVEKSNSGASTIYSLNKFKVRYDSKVEKAYLLGRYGAIPVFKEFNNFSDCKED